MKSKVKCFNYSNNYFEKIISDVTNISTNIMGYTEDNSVYYYWYDKKHKQTILENIDKIKDKINCIERCEVSLCNFQCDDNQVSLVLIRNFLKI